MNDDVETETETEISPTLILKFRRWPVTLDAPEGAYVMLQLAHGGQITLSESDWNELMEYARREDRS